jgi:hypothetical protein
MSIFLGAVYNQAELSKQMERLKSRKKRLDDSIKQGKAKEIIEANKYVFLKKLKEVEQLMK